MQSACPKGDSNGLMHRSKIAASFNHLVGAGEDCWRQLDAQRSGDAEVDPKIELGGTFERQVARLCAFQNAIKLRDQVTKSVGKIRPERHKACVCRKLDSAILM